ncbi:MAG: hypothetical protein CM15mP62_02950 [Rhodospirillaceae bacterium]|nr:MAG: hypothetical protein CM15mP62_02950 [Rhodospirillaceae bacterium]
MAHKKAGGSSRNGRDSAGRRLGVKKFGGESLLRGILCKKTWNQILPGAMWGWVKKNTPFIRKLR